MTFDQHVQQALELVAEPVETPDHIGNALIFVALASIAIPLAWIIVLLAS